MTSSLQKHPLVADRPKGGEYLREDVCALMLELAVQTKESGVEFCLLKWAKRAVLAVYVMCPTDMVILSVYFFPSGMRPTATTIYDSRRQ